MKMVGGRRVALGTACVIAAGGMSFTAAGPSQAASPSPGSTRLKLASCPSHPVTFYGASGACVKLIQQLLIKHDVSVGSSGADGHFGSATRSAVGHFQRNRTLNVTGVVDALTWKALLSFGPTGRACVTKTFNHLTKAQRVGQLIMVGMEHGNQGKVHRLISDHHVGNVVYLGGWRGDASVGRTSDGLQRRATSHATGGVGMLVAADQEGGEVQQLTGSGFSRIPSALTQGKWSSARQKALGQKVGQQLRDVGVNVNLAPVADTVPKSLGTGNGPIGRYHREFGYTPGVVARGAKSFVDGLNSRHEIAAIKHFPGIGRIKNNTDTSSTGITDTKMTAHDPYLKPFRHGINPGAGMVMIGLARYPKIDASHQAAFSHKIVTGILRKDMKFHDVVVSDSLSAVAVKHVPVGQRAVRFIEAGGDIALTGAPNQVPAMISGVLAKMKDSTAFTKKVDKSVHRVLAIKSRHGLLGCS